MTKIKARVYGAEGPEEQELFRAMFDGVPAKGSRITYNEKSYLVREQRWEQGGGCFNLVLVVVDPSLEPNSQHGLKLLDKKDKT